jgi:hypothetical protein
MKKALIVFLILAVAGGLFAQEAPTFTWTGEFVTGAHVVVNEDLDDPQLTLANDDGRNRVRLNGAIVGPTYGFNFRLQAANIAVDSDLAAGTIGDFNTSRAVTMPFAYGYITFFDNLLKVTAGHIDPKAWNSGPVIDTGWDHEAAVRFEFTPPQVSGLNVGFSLKPPTRERPHSLSAVSLPIADALLETVIGVKYTGLSILDITAALKLDGDDAAKDMNASLGVSLKGIPNLTTAAIEVVGLNLNDLEDTGTGEIRLGQRVTYVISALTLQLSAREHIYTLKDKDLGLRIEPQVAYKINDSLTATLYAGIGSGDTFEHLGFEIKPSLTYTVGKATIDFIYRFNSHAGRPDLWTVAADGTSLQAIGANLKWTF